MLRQIKILCGIALKTSFGINEMRHSGDKRKRSQFIMVCIAIGILFIYVAGSISGLSIMFAAKKTPEMIPIFIATITCAICFIFTLIKSGDLIFNQSDYESIIPLPVKPSTIVISRFLTAYLLDALFSFGIMLPGAIIYAIFKSPGIVFYLSMLLGSLILPLIPMTLGSAINSGVLAILSRFRFRKTLNVIVGVFFSIAIIVGSFAISFQASSSTAEAVTNDPTNSALYGFFNKASDYYFPIKLFANGATKNSFVDFLLFMLASFAVFFLYVFIFGKNFKKVSSALAAKSTAKKFVRDTQGIRSPLKALYFKELKALFSSTTYIMNCGIGYIMAGIYGVAVAFFLPPEMRDPKFLYIIQQFSPLIMAFCVIISPSTSCSISFEGKHLWILQSLPLKSKTVFDSKLLVSLTLALPFYLIAVVSLILKMNFSPAQLIYTILVPLLFIIFSSVIGLRVDMKSPTLNWEKEAEAIKQNLSVLFTMLWGFLSVIAAGVLAAFLNDLGYFIVCVALLSLSILFYSLNCKTPLKKIGD